MPEWGNIAYTCDPGKIVEECSVEVEQIHQINDEATLALDAAQQFLPDLKEAW